MDMPTRVLDMQADEIRSEVGYILYRVNQRAILGDNEQLKTH